jgi:DNA-directed RNA polymerase specialized sigma24 family protein
MTTQPHPEHPLEADARDVDPGPPSNVRLTAALSTAELHAFVGDKATQKHLLDVIWKRMGKGAPKDLVEDLVQQASLAMLSAKLGPHSAATASGWASRVAVCTVVDYFRREEVQAKWVDRKTDVENLPPDPDDASGPFAPDWLVTRWLAPLVAGDPRHQETYELLRYKAATDKTLAQVAAEHGMTEGALKSRIHTLKPRYEPQWKRRQQMFLLLLLFAATALAVLAWLLLRPAIPEIGPDIEPMPRPKATATVTVPEPEPFNQSMPTFGFGRKSPGPTHRP